jgi:hypothetical protein
MSYKDCWVIIHKQRTGTQEQVLRQRRSAILVYEAKMRQMLDTSVESGTLLLYCYDADGDRTLIARTLIRRRQRAAGDRGVHDTALSPPAPMPTPFHTALCGDALVFDVHPTLRGSGDGVYAVETKHPQIT